jgi:hypothetical protein
VFFATLSCAAPAQVLQTWTQKSLAGDAVTAGESSAAVAADANYMFAADNEHETLRLFARYPVSPCVDPIYSTNMRPHLNLTSTDPEDDIEAAAMAPETNRIYWLGAEICGLIVTGCLPPRFSAMEPARLPIH